LKREALDVLSGAKSLSGRRRRLLLAAGVAALASLALSPALDTYPAESIAATAYETAESQAADDGPAIASPQQDGDSGAQADDQRLPVQLWTVLAAGGATAVGLVLYLLRLAIGWVKPPPPPQDESQH
jgi:hypothetical protein